MAETLVIRAAESTDFDRILQLVQQHYGADYGEPIISRADLQNIWNRREIRQHTCLIEAAHQIVAYAYFLPQQHDDASTTIHASLYTAPDQRDQGFEAMLLRQIERAAPSAAPRTLQVTATNPAARSALEALGYSHRISFQTMGITLQPGYAAAAPEHITIAPLVAGQDEEAAYQADEAASRDKGYAQPTPFEQWSARMLADLPLCFVARDGAEIAGGVYGQRFADEQYGIVHHLGVRREWRNHGIGRALLERVFQEFAAHDIHKITLDVDAASRTGADKLYAACGMRTSGTRHLYKKQLEATA
jgi:GNAT superfamily N-acetyltransferase